VYLLSAFMRAGMSLFALRLPAALLSVAALIPFYLLARRVVAAVPALLTTWLLATDVWYLHFSRSGWDNVYTCLFITATALCIDNAVRHGRWRSFIGAGIWSAFSLYGYAAGRAILPAALIVMLGAAVRPSIARRRLATGAAVTTLLAAGLFAPQIPAIAANWHHFQERARFVYVLRDHGDRSLLETAAIVLANFGHKGVQVFSNTIRVPQIPERPDRYLRTRYGALVRPSAALLLIGLLLSVSSQTLLATTWQWWVFLLVSFGMTQALTFGSLNGARGIIFVPLLYLFIGLAVDHMWRAARRLHRAAAPVLVAGALVLSAWSTREYFEWAQSERLLAALEPAIPVEEFPQWQAYVLDWTAQSTRFFNVGMWKERRRNPQ
jgi:hypothetical protein